MGYRTFVAFYLSIVVAVSSVIIVAAPRIQTQDETASANHFSVRWMGFAPAYSSQYPEYYVCINNLAADPVVLQIALQIKNQENQSFYFRVEADGTPPAGWSLPQYDVEDAIDKDETRAFTYSAFRTNPSSISLGRLTEMINLVVKAFYDAGYTQLYSQDSFSVTFNFLDRMAGAWTTLYHDDFDDGQTDQWTWIMTQGQSPTAFGVSTDYYRSFSYSLKLQGSVYQGAFRKSFDVAGTYSEAYLVYSVRSSKWSNYGVKLDGVKYFEQDVALSPNIWYQVSIPLPTGRVTEVQMWVLGGGGGTVLSYLDDVYVIAM